MFNGLLLVDNDIDIDMMRAANIVTKYRYNRHNEKLTNDTKLDIQVALPENVDEPCIYLPRTLLFDRL